MAYYVFHGFPARHAGKLQTGGELRVFFTHQAGNITFMATLMLNRSIQATASMANEKIIITPGI